ncbi:hypothetical protein M407DRAFT_22105 [Tulasnella calospora MUT 4182]|uniref:Protein kinase domain-containing protein n=1 Tax=Tulasnella calospora MUT 4182 TaxID=1051891 RepID=A0A0C3M4R1_9AGAM|nr:hypothetical protein M407DRAFT_22105 [Tulasnella calospora MUT 4182]
MHLLGETSPNLQHLSIDIVRLKPEPDFKGSRGGSCEVQVVTLDCGIPATSKLIAAKKLFFGKRSSEPKRLAFRLARELKIWAELCLPHIPPLLGFYLGDDYKTAMLISEYMLYGDLDNHIAKMAPTYFERMHLVRDLTDGLAYLHSQTIRHGDLKPGNVLVNPQRRALLADLGLSSSLDGGSSGFTNSNGGAATVRFSSPEILFQGAAGRLLANDIWSWGGLVLGVLAEKIPFANLQLDSQIMIAHISHQFPCDVEALALRPPQFASQWPVKETSGLVRSAPS